MELGWNHPISPLALADVIGLDVLPAVVQTIHDEFADSKYRPKLFILLVRAGRLELPRPLGQQILSLPRLPFRHARSSASRLYARRTTGQPARRLGSTATHAGSAPGA
jgi:3-hydroxyacyl-CoA dehydrogenase